MLKKLGALAVLAVSSAGMASACDLDMETRSKEVATYLDAVKPCLTDLPEGYWWDYEMETQFFDAINEERAKRDLAPLKRRYETKAAARFHSLDMAVNQYFEHEGPDSRSVGERVTAFDRRAISVFMAENIAKQDLVIDPPDPNYVSNYDFSEAFPILHKGLMDSDGHRKNILHEKATHVTVGVVRTKNGVWVTQNFLGLSGNLSEDLPVRLASYEELSAKPYFVDTAWTFKKYLAVRENGQSVPFEDKDKGMRVTRGLSGTVNLAIQSQRPGETSNITYTQDFFGPSFTVEG